MCTAFSFIMNKVYKSEESNLHAGHRKRLKNKYLTLGIGSLKDEEILELLLFYALPQGDTSNLAHRLLTRFGSLSAILDTPRERLLEVSGINEHSAIYLSLLTDVGKLYRMDKINADNLYESKEKIGRYVTAFLGAERRERTALLCFDRQRRLISGEVIFDEAVGQLSTAHIRKICTRALGVGAYSVVLAHNHTSGIAEPSENDLSSTNALDISLGGVGVQLIEHFIVTDESYIGIKDFIENNGYDNL